MDKKLSDLTTGDIVWWLLGLTIDAMLFVGIVILILTFTAR